MSVGAPQGIEIRVSERICSFFGTCRATSVNVDAHGKPSTMVSVRGACGADTNPKCKQRDNTKTTKTQIAREGPNTSNKNNNANAQQQKPKSNNATSQ